MARNGKKHRVHLALAISTFVRQTIAQCAAQNLIVLIDVYAIGIARATVGFVVSHSGIPASGAHTNRTE